MPRWQRHTSVITIVLLVGGWLFFSAGPALGHFDDSRISLHVNAHRFDRGDRVVFFGRLNNEHRRCERNESVQLRKRRRGGGSRFVDSTRTDGEGEFRFSFRFRPRKAGRYFARYNGSGRFGYNNNHRCGRDRSPSRRIGR